MSTFESEPSEVELKSTDLNNKCQIMKIKDSIKDNIIHFVNNKSNPYDKDALSLVKNNKIESKQDLNIAVNSIIKLKLRVIILIKNYVPSQFFQFKL